MSKSHAKMVRRATKNGATAILTTDSNLATSKTPKTAISFKSHEFDKLTLKSVLTYGKDILDNLPVSKIFPKVTSLYYVKFDEKHPNPYDSPFSSYAQIFCKNGAWRHRSYVTSALTTDSNFANSKTPMTTCKSNEFAKLTRITNSKIFASVSCLYVKSTRNMETSQSPYNPPFSSYA